MCQVVLTTKWFEALSSALSVRLARRVSSTPQRCKYKTSPQDITVNISSDFPNLYPRSIWPSLMHQTMYSSPQNFEKRLSPSRMLLISYDVQQRLQESLFGVCFGWFSLNSGAKRSPQGQGQAQSSRMPQVKTVVPRDFCANALNKFHKRWSY